MKARRILTSIALIAAATAAGSFALAQAPAAPGGAPRPAIATVGPKRIAKDEFEARASVALRQFQERSGNRELPGEIRDLVRRQVLEGMIRVQLLSLEAARTGVTVDPQTAEEQLKSEPFFNPNGKFDETRFLTVKTTQPAAFAAARANIASQLAARKLNDQLEAKYAPADADLRASAERQLSRVTVAHLSLRRSEFDGSYPEPRESAVLEYYRTHGDDYRRPDRATLTVAFVNTPGLSDSARAIPAALNAWNSRMRQVADSVLRVIQSGKSFDEAAAFLSPRPGVIVTSDNFPGYWQGTPAQSAALFKSKPGEVLGSPVATLDGYLIARVDDVTPAHVAALHDVAREIRAALRKDSRKNHTLYAARELYASLRDSLAGPGVRLRWCAIDTARVSVSEPTAEVLDRYYRGHLADYSSFDSKTSAIVARPYSEVRDEVRARWMREQRLMLARLAADELEAAWRGGKSVAATEARHGVRGPLATPLGADIDSGVVASALSDSLWKRVTPNGTGLAAYPGGWIVWQTMGRVEKVTPTFEQARTAIEGALETQERQKNEAGGRKLFDSDPMRFNLGNVIHFTRAVFDPIDLLNVKLSRAEVVKWHRDHIDRYSAPEEMRVRHILIAPANASPEADRAAREKATALLQRLRDGEDFTRLARENSDDPSTKDKGGDLGTFGRGVMLAPFEKAAFALRPGDLVAAPVKTEMGYHLIRCEEYSPAVVQPLELIYTNVASECALAKADTVAQQRADSLVRVARTAKTANAVAEKMGAGLMHYDYHYGEGARVTTMRPYFDAIEKLKPGEVMRKPFRTKGQGVWVAWVDSISPPLKPSWDDARERAIAEYSAGAGRRALEAKKVELDSMLTAGWSFDSLATLWAGPEVARDIAPGRGLNGLGGVELVDSLLFGSGRSAPLPEGALSAWLDLPNALTRLMVLDRTTPPADQLKMRMANLRASLTEMQLRDYFDNLGKRYPVRILDKRLSETSVPAPPPIDHP